MKKYLNVKSLNTTAAAVDLFIHGFMDPAQMAMVLLAIMSKAPALSQKAVRIC